MLNDKKDCKKVKTKYCQVVSLKNRRERIAFANAFAKSPFTHEQCKSTCCVFIKKLFK